MLGLLEGERMWIEPRGFEEIHARGNTEAHRLQDPSKWVPVRRRRDRGEVAGALPVLEPGRPSRSRAPRREYGPGEEPRPRDGEPTASAHGELL